LFRNTTIRQSGIESAWEEETHPFCHPKYDRNLKTAKQNIGAARAGGGRHGGDLA